MKSNFVIFGASGDLAQKYLFPALANLHRDGHTFNYFGFARTQFSQPEFVQSVALASNSDFASLWHYCPGSYDVAGLKNLSSILPSAPTIFYLAVPTTIEIIQSLALALKANNLITPGSILVIEKPFGRDYASALRLRQILADTVGLDNLFLVDHYLTKELVKNIISLRFANPIFESLWNNRYIDHISIQTLETKLVAGRGAFYDQTGTIRDVIQNHCLQLLSLVTIDQPTGFSQSEFSHQKQKILKKISLFDHPANSVTVGQYRGYRHEPQVSSNSLTETSAHLTLKIDSPRWRGVPLNITAGKKMSHQLTQIEVVFNRTVNCLWGKDCPNLPLNKLTINLSPQNEIRLSVNSGFNPHLTLPQPVDLFLGFPDESSHLRPAYENVILDIIQNVRVNSPTFAEILSQWRIIDPIVATLPSLPLDFY